MLIDIHTHHSRNETIAVRNLHEQFQAVTQPGMYSIGLHPWYLDENWQRTLLLLEEYASNPNVVAIGECGLDKACAVDMHLQKEAFFRQILLANKIKKPLIIHCVRAFEETVQLLKTAESFVPVVFHGFNRNKHVADFILKSGYYISFGKDINKESIKSIFAQLPADRIFLETDNSDVLIGDVYKTAAQVCNIELDELLLQIEKNIQTVFGKKFY